MTQFFAILSNTFWEAVRQPAYGLILIITSMLTLATPLSGAHIYTLTLGTQSAARSIAEMGLSTILLAGMILTVFVAAGVVSREIEEKTALTVLTKFVGRFTFIAGKFAGVAAAVGVAVISWSILVMLTARFGSATAAYDDFDYVAFGGVLFAVLAGLAVATWRNYFAGKSWVGNFSLAFFCALLIVFVVLLAIGATFPTNGEALGGEISTVEKLAGAFDWQVAIAAGLVLEAILMLTGLAVAFSARLKIALNFTVCLCFFIAGLTLDYFIANYGGGENLIAWLLMLVRAITPALQAFWMSEALKYETTIPLSYALSCSLYACLYVMATLTFAAGLFERREIQ